MVRAIAVALVVLLASSARADPTPGLARAVRRWVSPQADPASCAPVAPVGGEARWECTTTECPGSCMVVHVITVLGVSGGRWRRVSQRRDRIGDTGECGCCLEGF
jgi:hypothetical protein